MTYSARAAAWVEELALHDGCPLPDHALPLVRHLLEDRRQAAPPAAVAPRWREFHSRLAREPNPAAAPRHGAARALGGGASGRPSRSRRPGADARPELGAKNILTGGRARDTWVFMPKAPIVRVADRPLAIRLPEVLIARLDRLARRLARDPAAVVHAKPSRSVAIRAAIVAGLDALDAAHKAQG